MNQITIAMNDDYDCKIQEVYGGIEQITIDRHPDNDPSEDREDSFSEIDDQTIIHSSSGDPESGAPSNNHPIENEVTKRDSRRVWHMKLLVLLILFLSAAGIAAFAYVHITTGEIKQHEWKFYNDADKVFNAIGSSFERTLTTLNAFSILLVTHSHTSNDSNDQEEGTNATTWPFVTLPNFAGQASKLLPITDGLYITVLPIVTPSQKQEWEEYAYQHDNWVNESLALEEVWDEYHGNVSHDWARSESVYDNFDIVYPNVRYDLSSGDSRRDCLPLSLSLTGFVSFYSSFYLCCSRIMLPQWQTFPIAPAVSHSSLIVLCTYTNRSPISYSYFSLFLNFLTKCSMVTLYTIGIGIPRPIHHP